MRVLNAVKKGGKWIATTATLAAGTALAEVPTAVNTALTDAKDDGISIATAVFVAIVAIFAFSLMRKALR